MVNEGINIPSSCQQHPSWVYIGMTPLQVLHLRPGPYPQPDSISSRVHSPSPSSKIWKSAAPENFTGCFCVSLRSFFCGGLRLESEKFATVKDVEWNK